MDVELPEIDVLKVPIDILKKTEAEKWKWVCKYEGCNHYSHLKDFGVFPMMFFRNKWVNIWQNYLLCAKHWKLRNEKLRLKHNYVEIDDINKIIR